jgi:glycyl-tRNA synthetase beta chain
MSGGSTERTRDFLVELGTEELPPLALPELERAFAAGVRTGLVEAALPFVELRSFATPRRLAVLVHGLAERQPAQTLKLKGPPVSAAFGKDGAPTAAATKFAEKCGVSLSALTRVTEGKGEFLFYSGSKPGVATTTLLPAIVQQALDALPIPKRMRWGSSNAEFVRPVHWLTMLFGGQLIEARILDTDSSVATRGHRFMAPLDLPLASPADYEATLRTSGKVIADFATRREEIRRQVEAVGKKLGGNALLEDSLLDEVTALVEWPSALAGGFEARFLELPREVLISTLQQHQRYFPVTGADGKLLPHFITVANIESRDPAKVRAGNERVVRPRLSDAAFFWTQDRKQPLAARLAGLDAVTFQAKLGSLGDKVRRVKTLAGEIALLIETERPRVERAAELAKCDLLTLMVGEFPELQGVMGRYYAAADGEAVEVSAAIDEHYLPRVAGGALPGSLAGVAVALADKLDTLAGIFSIGQKPSGTKDPFGLRRAAIGVLRILVEKKLDLDLRALVMRAIELQPVSSPAAPAEVWDYVVERLRSYCLDSMAGVTTEMFDAVLASEAASPLDFVARLSALLKFLGLPDAASLTSANKRIANILKKSDVATARTSTTIVSTATVSSPPAQLKLEGRLVQIYEPVKKKIANKSYESALEDLATLRTDVDAFFDSVMVNDPDPEVRAIRMRLLADLRALFTRIADLSRLPG